MFIGHTVENELVRLNQEDRNQHSHVIGSTGRGKSKLLEQMIREDLKNEKAGLCLIDPHGELYDEIVDYIAQEHPSYADRLILFNPGGDRDNVLGFNPAAGKQIATVQVIAKTFVSACLKAWGQENSKDTPRIRKALKHIIIPLIENQLTLAEADIFLDVDARDERARILKNVTNNETLRYWKQFDHSIPNPLKRVELLEGADNRLQDFLGNEIIKRILGQRDHSLDFFNIMEEGKILLVNLSTHGLAFDKEDTELLGILLVNEIYLSAQRRNPRDKEKKPFYLYIDEFQNLITETMGKSVAELRKYGVFLTLAHQHLAQLKEYDRDLYDSVLTNCTNKYVFGGLADEDAAIMEAEIFNDPDDLLMIKNEIWSRKEKSVESIRETRSYSRGGGKTRSKSRTFTKGKSNASTETVGEGGGSSHAIAKGKQRVKNFSETDGFSDAISRTSNFSNGGSKTKSVTRGEQESNSEGGGESRTQGHIDSSSDGLTNTHTSGNSRGQGETTDRYRRRTGYSSNFGDTKSNSNATNSSRSHSDSNSSTQTKNFNHTKGTSFQEGESIGENWNRGGSKGNTHTDNHSTTRGDSDGESETLTDTENRNWNRSTANTVTDSYSEGNTEGESETENWSEAVTVGPFMEKHEYQELSSREHYSLTDAKHINKSSLKNQGRAQVAVKIGNWKRPLPVKVAHVSTPYRSDPVALPHREALLESVVKNNDHLYLPVDRAQNELDARWDKIIYQQPDSVEIEDGEFSEMKADSPFDD